jgi:hypothetical protein
MWPQINSFVRPAPGKGRIVAEIEGTRSKSGVFVANDFRDNLIIDRYDPCFTNMRAWKKKGLRSENSEDVITWNVFRSLRQISPQTWLPSLVEGAFPGRQLSELSGTTVELWKTLPPPPSLLLEGEEGDSEIDIVIESPNWVWFIEAKYTSDISSSTTTRPERDQVLRNIDVGSYYAGTRDFYFALLIRNASTTPTGVSVVEQYREFEAVRNRLPHRHDALPNLRGVGLLSWSDLAGILHNACSITERTDEAIFAERALNWLRARDI